MASGETILNVRVAQGTVRLARPTHTSIYHLRASVFESSLASIAYETINWLSEKLPEPVPQELKSFEIGTPGQNARCSYLPEAGLWAARLTHPDDTVAGRIWVTEVGLASTGESVEFAIRVNCISSKPGLHVNRTRPSLIKKLATKYKLVQNRRIEPRPWFVKEESDLRLLELLLVDKNRQLPVVLVSEVTESGPDKYIFDVAGFAQQAVGVVHVVCLPQKLTFAWSNQVGAEWSAYQGAVRIYKPGLDFAVDSPQQHPLALPLRVLDWQNSTPGRDLPGPDAFSLFVFHQGLSLLAKSKIEMSPCLFYGELQIMEASSRTKAASGPKQERDALASEVLALKAKMNELRELLDLADQELAEVNGDRSQLESENYRLRARLLTMEATLTSAAHAVVPAPPPDNYRDIINWVDTHLIGQLALVPRARRGLRDAEYKEPSLVAESLLLLATHYRDMKLGVEGARERFQSRLGELGLTHSPSISETRAGEEGDEYYVQYPSIQSPRRFLSDHLKTGTSHENRYALRVYFYFDEERNEVVVGSLPGHLSTRMS